MLELTTRLSAIFGFLTLLASANAHAVCVVEPFAEQLKSADAVFVATVVSGNVLDAPDKLKDKRPYRTEFAFVVREVLKGNPRNTRAIYIDRLYDDPKDGRIFHHGEATQLNLGQSVLVLAKGTEDVAVSLCSGSRLVTTANLREARSRLSSN